jgi:hypothetical protein
MVILSRLFIVAYRAVRFALPFFGGYLNSGFLKGSLGASTKTRRTEKSFLRLSHETPNPYVLLFAMCVHKREYVKKAGKTGLFYSCRERNNER